MRTLGVSKYQQAFVAGRQLQPERHWPQPVLLPWGARPQPRDSEAADLLTHSLQSDDNHTAQSLCSDVMEMNDNQTG